MQNTKKKRCARIVFLCKKYGFFAIFGVCSAFDLSLCQPSATRSRLASRLVNALQEESAITIL